MSNIQPVLLGADLNCYHVARAFHEAYGVRSKAFGRYPIGVTQYTRIIDFTTVPDMDNPSVMIDTLRKYADENKDKKLILLGCTDDYVSLISRNREFLENSYVIPYISPDLMDHITLKEKFYELCDEMGIDHPLTYIFRKETPLDHLAPEILGFDYPIIIKPSSSTLYWKYPFDGMKKVYSADTREEAAKIITEIYASGYPDSIILQDRIPGDDSFMYVLTSYSDREGRVRMMCLGHVLLEEHTPKGQGNHAAIITEYNEELMLRFKALLEKLHFIGYSNFDIKYDPRDGKYKAFEINVRLGRSNYYVTASGNNAARFIVDEYIEDNLPEGCLMNKKEVYWRYIPDKIVYKYSSDALKAKVKSLLKSGDAYSSMRYKPDLCGNLKRRLFIMIHEHNHIKKFKTYYHPETLK